MALLWTINFKTHKALLADKFRISVLILGRNFFNIKELWIDPECDGRWMCSGPVRIQCFSTRLKVFYLFVVFVWCCLQCFDAQLLYFVSVVGSADPSTFPSC